VITYSGPVLPLHSCPGSDSTPRALSSDPRLSSAANADQFDAAPNGAMGGNFFAARSVTSLSGDSAPGEGAAIFYRRHS
jgi:hypothetical protein